MKKAAEKAKSLFPEDKHHLRLGFCIPGILYPEKAPSQLDHALLTKTFAVNTIGPLLMMKHFTPFLPRKATDMVAQTPDSEGVPEHAVLPLPSFVFLPLLNPVLSLSLSTPRDMGD